MSGKGWLRDRGRLAAGPTPQERSHCTLAKKENLLQFLPTSLFLLVLQLYCGDQKKPLLWNKIFTCWFIALETLRREWQKTNSGSKVIVQHSYCAVLRPRHSTSLLKQLSLWFIRRCCSPACSKIWTTDYAHHSTEPLHRWRSAYHWGPEHGQRSGLCTSVGNSYKQKTSMDDRWYRKTCFHSSCGWTKYYVCGRYVSVCFINMCMDVKILRVEAKRQ